MTDTIEFESGAYKIAIADIPAASVAAMLQQSFNHRLGNQADSRLVAFAKANGHDIGEWRASDEGKAKLAEFRDATVRAILDGTLGVRKPGAGRKEADPVEKEYQKLLVAAVKKALKDNYNVSLPKDETAITFGNATRTRSQMLENFASKFGAALREQAEKNVRAAQRAIDKAAQNAVGANVDNPDELGL